jgi:hypothetical protein
MSAPASSLMEESVGPEIFVSAATGLGTSLIRVPSIGARGATELRG